MRSGIIGVNMPDRREEHDEADLIHAEFVLVVKDGHGVDHLYQMKEETHAYMTISDDAFMMLGGVVAIDKKFKRISFKSDLGHERIITYDHLVVVADAKHAVSFAHINEFCAAYQALSRAKKTEQIRPQFDPKREPPKDLLKKMVKQGNVASLHNQIKEHWHIVEHEAGPFPNERIMNVQL